MVRIHPRPPLQLSIYEHVSVRRRDVVAHRRVVGATLVCKRCATGDDLVESSHAFLETDPSRVQIGRGLGYIRMPEHLLDVMEGPPGFEEATPRLMPEIVEVQVDGTQGRP